MRNVFYLNGQIYISYRPQYHIYQEVCSHHFFFLYSSEINWVVRSEGKVQCNINLESRSSPTSVSGIKMSLRFRKGIFSN